MHASNQTEKIDKIDKIDRLDSVFDVIGLIFFGITSIFGSIFDFKFDR